MSTSAAPRAERWTSEPPDHARLRPLPLVVRPFLPASGTIERPTVLAWLDKFEVCLVEEGRETFGPEWELLLDVHGLKISAVRKKDGALVTAPLHPGLHVVLPLWAAHRLIDQLQLAAIAAGHLPPLPGTVF